MPYFLDTVHTFVFVYIYILCFIFLYLWFNNCLFSCPLSCAYRLFVNTNLPGVNQSVTFQFNKYIKYLEIMKIIIFFLVIVLSPRMRAYLLYIRFRLIKREVVNTLVKKSKMGDWFLFYMLGQNVDSMIFKEVMHELARRLGHQSKDFNDA